MKFAIADPPYPESLRMSGGPKPRGSRWYGDRPRGNNRQRADHHPEADEWADHARHRALMLELEQTYDGWAIATSPDGLEAYGQLPIGARVAVWVKPNAIPGSHRLRNIWEPILIYVPAGRRRNVGRGAIPDVFTASAPRKGFAGAKPEAWTHWVLDAFSYDPATDEVVDLFPGSGSVAAAVATYEGR